MPKFIAGQETRNWKGLAAQVGWGNFEASLASGWVKVVGEKKVGSRPFLLIEDSNGRVRRVGVDHGKSHGAEMHKMLFRIPKGAKEEVKPTTIAFEALVLDTSRSFVIRPLGDHEEDRDLATLRSEYIDEAEHEASTWRSMFEQAMTVLLWVVTRGRRGAGLWTHHVKGAVQEDISTHTDELKAMGSLRSYDTLVSQGEVKEGGD